MRVFHDWEFLELGPQQPIRPISVGMVREDGAEYYAVLDDTYTLRLAYHQHSWLRDNVLPHLPLRTAGLFASSRMSPWPGDHPDAGAVKCREQVADEIREFVTADGEPELWAWYGAYDHVCLAQLFGTMADLPPGMPMVTHELVQLWEDAGRPPLPEPGTSQHHALADARWNRQVWEICQRH